MTSKDPTLLYLRLKRRITIRPQAKVRVKDVAHTWIEDTNLLKVINEIVIYEHHKQEGDRAVVDLIQLLRLLKENFEWLQIEAYGDPQVLIMVSEQQGKPKLVMMVICWLVLFFGSGLALMNFHSDVNMKETHIRIVELITGKRDEHPLWFQIPYSFGVGIGMILFFNHIFRKKFNEEPNPLEVEMYLYQENVNTYVIAEEIRKKQEQAEVKHD